MQSGHSYAAEEVVNRSVDAPVSCTGGLQQSNNQKQSKVKQATAPFRMVNNAAQKTIKHQMNTQHAREAQEEIKRVQPRTAG